ncbi:hypothetical protein E3U47_18750 [Pseudomonas sp. RIT623]|nr:hypothetical protein E3U47_18750 [Pseudomonas sp. RIT623]
MPFQFKIAGVALRPFRGTRPLLQDGAVPCRCGLVPRKDRNAVPALPVQARKHPSVLKALG